MREKSIIMKRIKDIQLSKLQIKMDLDMLDMIIRFIYKPSVLRTRKALKNISTLVDSIDMNVYSDNENEVEIKNRFWIIRETLYAMLTEGLTSINMMTQFCYENPECNDYIKETMESIINGDSISYDDSKYLIRQIDDRLDFGYVITLKDAVNQLFDMLDESDSRTYKSIEEDLYQIATSIIGIKRGRASLGTDNTFSLQEEVMKTVVGEAMDRLKNRNRIFITGIRRLNTFLSPGYMAKRLYVYLAFPGGGKSQILLKSALDIRMYNTYIQTKDPDKRPAVLFITMENSIEETVERIFNMTSSDDDIRNYTTKQVIKKLRTDGQLTITQKNNVDLIIKYYDNQSIDTNDLYGIIQDLEDEGIETIALFLDYLKRIRPAQKSKDGKEALKNITNELKVLASYFDIPVITAQQLNRAAAGVIDAAKMSKKEDLAKLIGRDAIGDAWEIQENADMTIIINQEIKADTGEMYLTFKLLKRRYRSSESSKKMRKLDFFHHPYSETNEIRLLDDLYEPESLSITSLSTTFVEIDDNGRGKHSMMEREEVKRRKKKDKESSGYNIDFEPFDFDNHVY